MSGIGEGFGDDISVVKDVSVSFAGSVGMVVGFVGSVGKLVGLVVSFWIVDELVKEPGCNCQGCCNYYFDVNIKSENRLAGMIKYYGICDDCCCCGKKEKGEEKTRCCDCRDCCHVLNHYGDIIDGNKEFK